ncbi:heparan-alpha-glucosaminide N-acetyltransferase domain-containing protein [Paraflavitalea sp. CAU 1676]|uniref:DUF1624 domain-containing protein n=1 Tax=Paraflavitalea sp. CAU 1676 TaxID=3032598 RepID=UPI0023DBBAD6|nr:heparan-alpha-glucosaminide N-acetyltransferase domain-containing protein [Paraflavitalea sp. CAU 1676]MDF2189009.1 heparan-alpha-glucosaminide N-acetyltransferase domain-containing protein [Paraflavitalea sp. CAU 1676]
MKRIPGIDFTRGTVMIIMALDHVRDLLHVNGLTQSPTDLTTTTPQLFFTRWITHLCAPIFVFLSGTSAFLSLSSSKDVGRSRRFLWKRGLYLILLEFTLVNFGLYFDPGFHTFIFEVIGAIGFGFILLSLMSRLSTKAIAIVGLVILFCHNLFVLVPFGEDSIARAILSPFFGPGAFPVFGRTLIIAYPPIPWLGIMLVGFAAGKCFEWEGQERKKMFVRLGCAGLLLFVLIRFVNVYGDPVPWSSQKNALYTFLSFMNITKYPPSLLFCLATLGIMFFILAFAENAAGRLSRIVCRYGKVPLFYFLLHFYLIHLIMFGVLLAQGITWEQMDVASGNFGRPVDIRNGLALWQVYLVWVIVVALLYKPCCWYGRYKATHQHWWLKFL